MSISTFHFLSPIGLLQLQLSDNGLQACHFVTVESEEVIVHHAEVQQIRGLLNDYFESGQLPYYPIDPTIGTSFQLSVWAELRKIPAGSSATYAEIAKRLNRPKAAQAVGNANGQNPVLLFNPCHRVIGASGNLVGYSGGLWRKEWLLAREGATLF